MVSRTTRSCSNSPGAAKGLEVKLITKRIDDANGIVGRNVVVEQGWKLDNGVALGALNVWHGLQTRCARTAAAGSRALRSAWAAKRRNRRVRSGR